MKRSPEIVIEPDMFEDGRHAWHAYSPVLKGCHTWGYTREEALANIREAIELYVDDSAENRGAELRRI